MRRSHRLNQVTTIGLLVILAIMTVSALWAAVTSRLLTQQASQAVALNNSYQQAMYWLSEENRTETRFRFTPTPAVEQEYIEAGNNFLAEMRQSNRISLFTDDLFNSRILSQHAQYQAMVQQEFTAIALQNHSGVIQANFQSDSLIAILKQQVQQKAQQNQILATHQMAQLSATQELIVRSAPLLFLPGFALTILCVALLHVAHRTEQRMLESALAQQVHEVTVQAELAQLQHSALTDSLTALGNHRAYQEARQREIAQAQQYGESLSLALIDIDEFKQYNDQYGHAYGDHILTTVAAVLQQTTANAPAFRLGGDEFAILLRHTTMDEATQALEIIRNLAQQQLSGLTVSVGIATLAPDAQNAATLQEQADAALYEAKRRGRNAVVTFAEIADRITLLTSAQAQALRQLIEEKHLSIVFQPIWDIRRQVILGYESLMRPDVAYGFSGPQEVFDIAERMGHTHELDAVCRAAILARASDLPANALLFINVAPQTLDHVMLAGNALVEAVLAAGLQPNQVVLEITERSIARADVVVREATRLRRLGFLLALDDVGAGNAGLEMLSHLAVDFVKIDREVIVNAPKDATARAVLAGIVAIARESRSYVIAEGIEDAATLHFIQGVGIHEVGSVQGVQGYLVGRPSPQMCDQTDLQGVDLLAA
ncbi:MAG: EAL domain-containing protein [Ktedonobacterales bacterium]|nr:EAL domain-containing protein [Ktedonobacterales bacterium]